MKSSTLTHQSNSPITHEHEKICASKTTFSITTSQHMDESTLNTIDMNDFIDELDEFNLFCFMETYDINEFDFSFLYLFDEFDIYL